MLLAQHVFVTLIDQSVLSVFTGHYVSDTSTMTLQSSVPHVLLPRESSGLGSMQVSDAASG